MNTTDGVAKSNADCIESCVICKSDEIRIIYLTKDMLYDIPGAYKIAQCRCCKTEFITPFPTVQFLNSLYTADKYYSFQQRKMNRFIREIRRRTRRLFPVPSSRKKSICDVGCGDGEFLDFAKQAGFQTFGVEQDGQAQALNTHTSHNILPRISDHKRTFDYIRSNHALEHVQNIKEIIFEMKMHLAPDGKILIGVPNAQSFIAKMFGKYWFYRGAPIHTMGLNQKSFEIICDEVNLKITKVVKRQTFRGTVGSVVILIENLLFGKSREPKSKVFFMLFTLIILVMPLNWLLTLLSEGDLLELIIEHNKKF